MVCFIIFPVAKFFLDKTGLRVSRLSVENILSHSSEKFSRGIFQCFINFEYRKTLGKKGGGGGTYVFLFLFSHC